MIENNSTAVTGNGEQLEWVHDGFCDDMNNNEEYDYDGGDCCGTLANKRFCLECECKSKSDKARMTQELDMTSPAKISKSETRRDIKKS